MSFLPTNLIGVTFSTTKTPVFNTEVVEGNGGNSRRNPIQVSRVRWRFQLTYEFVYKLPPGPDELFGFFASLHGASTAFLYRDPTDNLVTTANGTFVNNLSDGTTSTIYQLARIMSVPFPYVETLTDGAWNASFGSDTFTVYANNVLVNAGHYSVSSTGGLTFSISPAAGEVLTWAGNFYFRVMIPGDAKVGLKASKFMNGYWQHDLSLQSALSL